MSSRLEAGFYWVRPSPDTQWEPAHFDGDDWWLTGSEGFMPMDIHTKIRMAAGTLGPGVHLDSIEAAKVATALGVLQRVADNDCTNPRKEAQDAMRLVAE